MIVHIHLESVFLVNLCYMASMFWEIVINALLSLFCSRELTLFCTFLTSLHKVGLSRMIRYNKFSINVKKEYVLKHRFRNNCFNKPDC